MSRTVTDQFFSGQGRVFLAAIDSATGLPGGFVHVGNAPACKLALKSETEDIYESMSGNQLLVKRIPRKKTADVSLQIHNWSKENLAIALFGENTAVAGGTVTAETVTAHLGENTPLAHVNLSNVVVKGTGLNSAITYELDKNYTVDANYGTIAVMTEEEQITAGATADIADGATLSVAYTYGAYGKTVAFANTGTEYQLRMEGVNTAESGEKFLVTVWRFIPDPIKDWSLIDDKTGPIDISGAALADTSRADGDQFLTMLQID